jgi:hypothetical protein
LLRKATHGNVLPDIYQANYFINGLQLHLQPQVRMGEPANLNDAITRAKLIETSYTPIVLDQQMVPTINHTNQGNQISNQPIQPNINQTNKDTAVDELAKMFEKMEIKLTNIERNQKKPVMRMKNLPRQVVICGNCKKVGHNKNECYLNKYTCYSCGNKGHTSTNCPNKEVQFIDEDGNEYEYYYENEDEDEYNDEEVYYTNEYEVYKAVRENTDNRKKPYVKKRPGRPQKVLRENFQPMEQIGRQEIPSGNMEADLPKIKKKRGPNRFDQEQEYDIIEDFINQKANITYGQLMKNSSNQMAKMKKVMTRPLIKEDN